MKNLVIADLRHSIRIWAGSLLVLSVVQLCSMWVVGLMMVGITNSATDYASAAPGSLQDAAGTPLTPDDLALLSSGIVTATSFALTITLIVGGITVRNVVNAIVYQRRRVIALWQLAGMTERQTLRILRGQVALLSLLALVIAGVAATLSTEWNLSVLRDTDILFTPPMSTEGVYLGYPIGGVIGLAISVFAVRGVSKELRSISALEAMRSEGVREIPMTRRKWVGMLIWGAIAITLLVLAATMTRLDAALNLALYGGILAIVAVNIGGPLIMVGLVGAWTRSVPKHVSASWFLARQTLLAASARTVAAAGSISVAVFLFTGVFSMQTAIGGDTDINGFVLLVGFPLFISTSGSIVLVFMAGQQREREIHLAELAGATPAQQRRQALFEALIVVATGSGIGLGLSVAMIAVMQPAIILAVGHLSMNVSWGHFFGVTAALLVLNVAATLIPTMIAHAARERIAIAE